MNRDHVIEKLLSFAITAAIVVPFDNETVRRIFIVLGQGHFFATYLYQYRAGRIGLQYLTSYVIVWFCLFVGYHFLNDPKILEIAAGVYFIFHFLVDERHLLGHTPSTSNAVEMLPFFILNSAFLFDVHYQLDLLPTLCVLSLLFVAVREWQRISRKEALSAGRAYFLIANLLSVVLLGFALERTAVSAGYSIGALVIFHYSNWYIHNYFLFRKRGRGLSSYLWNVAAINFVVIGAALWRLSEGAGARHLDLFFSTNNFYLWTLLHLIFTTRAKDFAYWPRWLRPTHETQRP